MSVIFDSAAARSRGGMGFHTFDDPIKLGADQQQRIARVGELSYQVLVKVSRLVAEAFAAKNPELAWVRELMLGSVPAEFRSLASDLMIAAGDKSPVSFFRADVVGKDQIAELQCPGSGWAYMRALEKHYGIPAQESVLLSAYQSWADGRRLSWWLQEPKFEASVQALVADLRQIGLTVDLATKAAEFDPETADAIIRRPQLPDLITEPKGRRLLERWADGQVDMDLLPTMVTETKYLMVILRHPQFSHLFTAEERELCPETILIHSKDQLVEGNKGRIFTMQEAVERHHKNYILKYGGGKKGLRSGCHAVYNLGVGSMKLADRQDLLARAIADAEAGEGWILQQFNPAYWNIDRGTVFGRPLRYFSIFRPHFFHDRKTGQVTLVRNSLTACPDWKVHTQSFAYVGVVV